MSSKLKKLFALALAIMTVAAYGCNQAPKPADDNTAKVEDKKMKTQKLKTAKTLRLLVKTQDSMNSQLAMNKNQAL